MKKLIRKAIDPIRMFLADSRSTGVLLILCTIISLVLANLGSGEWYRNLFHQEIHYGIGVPLPHAPIKWINEFLMAIFFLFAGMEIKRELTVGELSSIKRAVLPFGAALGGMLVPALLYALFNMKSGQIAGWGIPTATDIAFSIGVASLFGKRVPIALTIFLMALAIIDDLGAIVVITLFYGGTIKWLFVAIAGAIYAALLFSNHKKIKPGVLHIVLGLGLWYALFNSGIESSITGVLVAFAMPVNALPKLEHTLHKLVNFLILPLFALANTAIVIPPDVVDAVQHSVSLGVMAGLVIGKPVGIFLFSAIMLKLKIAHLPHNTNLKQLFGIGSLAGIGFTMSIFTTSLAFPGEAERDISKIAILLSLVLSVAISGVYFYIISRKAVKFKASTEHAHSKKVSLANA